MQLAEYLTDEDLSAIRLDGDSFTRSIPLSRRGYGSLFVEVHKNGLVKLSHRVREIGGSSFTKAKIGFHLSCKEDFSTKHPNEHFLTLDEALIEAEKLGIRGASVGSYKSVHVSFSTKNTREKAIHYATVEDVLRGYINYLDGRVGHSSAKSVLSRYALGHSEDDPNRQSAFLSMQAKDARQSDLTPIISHMYHNLGCTTQCNSLIDKVRSSFTWAMKEDSNVRDAKGNKLKFAIETNYFRGMTRYTEFVSYGKPQFTDRELWCLWHEGVTAMGLLGRISRLLIAMGGVRQWHILRCPWSSFEYDNIYPNVELTSRKTGVKRGFDPMAYSCVLPPLALYELLELQKITGHTDYLIPKRTKSGHIFIPDKHYGTPGNASVNMVSYFDKLSDVVSAKYGYSLARLSMGRIRTSVSTRMGVAGIPDATKNMIQNNNQRNIQKDHYDRYAKLKEKLEALLLWEDYLRVLLNKPFCEVEDVYPEAVKVSTNTPAQIIAKPL